MSLSNSSADIEPGFPKSALCISETCLYMLISVSCRAP